MVTKAALVMWISSILTSCCSCPETMIDCTNSDVPYCVSNRGDAQAGGLSQPAHRAVPIQYQMGTPSQQMWSLRHSTVNILESKKLVNYQQAMLVYTQRPWDTLCRADLLRCVSFSVPWNRVQTLAPFALPLAFE